MLPSERYKCRFVLIWTVLLLLQQFHLVLLLNVNIVQKNEAMKTILVKRDIGDPVTDVIAAIAKSTDKMKQKDKSFYNNIVVFFQSCDRAEKDEAMNFWKSQPTVYPIYLMLSTIPLYLMECSSILKLRIEELLNTVEKNDVIDFILDLSEDQFQSLLKKNITEENVDIDDVSNIQMAEGADLVVSNIESINALSDIINNMNSSTVRQVYGLESVLENTIKEYEVLSDIFNTESERRKRSVLVSNIPLITSFAARKNRDIKYTLVQTLVDKKRNKFKNELRNLKIYNINHSHYNYISNNHRTKRSVSSTLPFFIRNSHMPCKLLMVQRTYDEFVLTFGSYDSENIQSHLWLYENGTIKNIASKLFLNTDGNLHGLTNTQPMTKINIHENSIYLVNSSNACAFKIENESGQAYLKKECLTVNQEWAFTTLDAAQENFIDVVCFFFIQSNDSCDVLTSDADNDSVVIKSVNTDDVFSQLWYWDGDYVKDSKSHRYLSSGFGGSQVRLLQVNEELNQKWVYKNGYMIAANLYEDIVLSKNNKVVVEAKHNAGYQKWNLVRTQDDNIASCVLNTGYFVIKNSNSPCKVLCTKIDIYKPSLLVQSGFAALFLAIGVMSGIILYHRLEKNICALCVGIFVGAAVSSLSLVIINFSSWFKETVVTPQFNYYDDRNPTICTWYTKDNYVFNLESDQAFFVSSDGMKITISDTGFQKWYFKDKNFISETVTNCFLSVNPNPDLTVTCSSYLQDQWSIIRQDNSLEFFENVNCLFFLKSNAVTTSTEAFPAMSTGTCGVLTTSGNGTEISVKLPSYEEFFNQLWYFRGNTVSNVKYGNVLPPQFNNYIPIEFNRSLQEPDLISCRNELFFIQSEVVPCMVLGIDNQTGDVELQYYDESKLSSQLWIYTSEMLLHYESGLYLSIQQYISKSPIVLDMNRHNGSQKWTMRNNYITSINVNDTCFLSKGIRDLIELDCMVVLPNTSQMWHFLPYDSNSEYLGNVLCTYFIKSENEPCELLTGNQETFDVVMRSASEDIFQSQLWYSLNNEIIHLSSGLSLGVSDDIYSGLNVRLSKSIFPNTYWTFNIDKLESKFKPGNLLTLNTLNGHVVLGKENPNLEFQRWILVDTKLALDNADLLTCSQNKTEKTFFIKSKSVACKLLTATEKGLSPRFEQFDESKINLQLWYWDFLHLINVETGLSLEVNLNTSEVTLSEHKTYYIQNKQFNKRGNTIIQKTQNDVWCGLTLNYSDNKHQNSDHQHITCRSNYFQHEWDFIDQESGLNDISSIMCIYLIRMQGKPCEYLTGFGRGLNLKMRPLVHELMKNQLFYLKGKTFVHMETALRITSNNYELILKDENNGTEQNWSYDKDLMYITNADESVVWAIDLENDGKLLVTSKYKSYTQQQWILQELTSTIKSFYIQEEYCKEESVVHSAFFLKNTEHPCLVLTAGNLGNPPEFKIFDDKNYKYQMWYFLNDHIINFGSGLAIMMDNIMVDGSFDIKMWHYYSFASLQMWVTDLVLARNVRNKMHIDCFLAPKNDEKNLIINGRCTPYDKGKWNFIEVDKEHEYLRKVTCMFFIQTFVTPCELLNGFGYQKLVRLRPIDAESVSQQLWFWDNNHIINADSGLALTASSASVGSLLYLTDKIENSVFQQWIYSNTFITLHNNFTLSIGVSRKNGDLALYPRNSDTNQVWKLIDQKEGVNNPTLLMCGSLNSNVVAYVIRSEHGDCPLLAHIGNNKIGTRMSDSGTQESKAWVFLNNHIISLDNSKSVSLQDDGELFLEKTFSFENRQTWRKSGDYLYTLYTEQDKLLTYVSNNYLSLEYPRGSSEQIWKWYTVKEIEDNDKLLRCSRCYDAQEETSNLVISYIPFLSWIYSAIRSVVYAVRNCPKVAWDTFKSLAIDLAIDAAIAVFIVVTGGAASAIALGIKTGMQAGFKAGLKVTFKAMKSMIKSSVMTFKNGLKNTLKRGFTKTLKAKLTTVKTSLTRNIQTIKSLPQRLKAFSTIARQSIKASVKATLKVSSELINRSKKLWKNRLNVMSRLGPKLKNALKNIPENIKIAFKKVVKNSKVILNRRLDKLAEPAEKALKKMDDIKFPNKLIRCRRMTNSGCRNDDLIIKAFNFRGATDLPNKWKSQYDELLDGIQGTQSGQKSVVGVKQSDKFIYKQEANINDMRQAGKPPIPKEKSDISPKIDHSADTNVMHTEQYLLSTMEDSLKNCHRTNPCDVFLYTKLSPCTQHPQSYAESCLKYIVDTCKQWFDEKGTRCHVGFEKFFNNNKPLFTSEWDKYFGSVMDNSKFDIKPNELLESLETKGFSKETIRITDEFLKDNVELIRENLVEKIANEGYEKLKKNIKDDFRDAYNNALKYLKDEKPNMANLVDKFKKELLNINEKTKNQLTIRFQNFIDNCNAVFSRETLNKFAAKRTVISDITEVAGGIETEFIDFSLLQ